jgi:hypothetical protein
LDFLLLSSFFFSSFLLFNSISLVPIFKNGTEGGLIAGRR